MLDLSVIHYYELAQSLSNDLIWNLIVDGSHAGFYYQSNIHLSACFQVACRSALANALNVASIIWWEFLPASCLNQHIGGVHSPLSNQKKHGLLWRDLILAGSSMACLATKIGKAKEFDLLFLPPDLISRAAASSVIPNPKPCFHC
eukprot:Gb_40906 [translate_table: standard]